MNMMPGNHTAQLECSSLGHAANDNPEGERIPQELLRAWFVYLLFWRVWAYQVRLWPPVKDWDSFFHDELEPQRQRFLQLCKAHKVGLKRAIAQLSSRDNWGNWIGAAMSDLADRRQGRNWQALERQYKK